MRHDISVGGGGEVRTSARGHAFVQRLWRGERLDLWVALAWVVAVPASILFRIGAAGKNLLFDRGWRRGFVATMPVVSVGNLSVGGTGKTPVSSWIVDDLSQSGLAIALLTRGYGADEVLLHRRWHPAVNVIADPDRVAAARDAGAVGAQISVLDDGFQHRRLARDLDVVLVAADDPLPMRPLPWGPYRESAAALRRADLILITVRKDGMEGAVSRLIRHVNQVAPKVPVHRLRLGPGRWLTLAGEVTEAPASEDLMAVCSIARPESFRATVVAKTGSRTELMAFPDHWEYSERDLKAIRRRSRGRPIVTTEKDAVKFHAHGEEMDSVLVLELRVVPGSGTEALSGLLDSVRDLALDTDRKGINRDDRARS